MTYAIHQYDNLSEQYILGELGAVVENEETARLSSELDALIASCAPSEAAGAIIETLADYSASCQRDGFTGGLSAGIRIGLALAAQRAAKCSA